MAFGRGDGFGEMFRDIGGVERRPGKEVIVFDGGKPGGLDGAKGSSMEEGYMVLDSMPEAVHVIQCWRLFEGREDCPEFTGGARSSEDELALVHNVGFFFVKDGRASIVAQSTNRDE